MYERLENLEKKISFYYKISTLILIGFFLAIIFVGVALFVPLLGKTKDQFHVDVQKSQVKVFLEDNESDAQYFEFDGEVPEQIIDYPKKAYLVEIIYTYVKIIYLFVMWIVIWRMFKGKNTFFDNKNINSIKKIGIGIILYGIYPISVRPLLLFSTHLGENVQFKTQNLLEYLIVGAMIIFLTEIFKYGYVLQQEIDETL